MTIPTPSFFKIRVVTLIFAFVVFCFFVGAVNDAFAGDTWDDTSERWIGAHLGQVTYNGSTPIYTNISGSITSPYWTGTATTPVNYSL